MRHIRGRLQIAMCRSGAARWGSGPLRARVGLMDRSPGGRPCANRPTCRTVASDSGCQAGSTRPRQVDIASSDGNCQSPSTISLEAGSRGENPSAQCYREPGRFRGPICVCALRGAPRTELVRWSGAHLGGQTELCRSPDGGAAFTACWLD